jgi:hypothetical protein
MGWAYLRSLSLHYKCCPVRIIAMDVCRLGLVMFWPHIKYLLCGAR